MGATTFDPDALREKYHEERGKRQRDIGNEQYTVIEADADDDAEWVDTIVNLSRMNQQFLEAWRAAGDLAGLDLAARSGSGGPSDRRRSAVLLGLCERQGRRTRCVLTQTGLPLSGCGVVETGAARCAETRVRPGLDRTRRGARLVHG